MSDENERRCNSRIDQGNITERGDLSQMNIGDEEPASGGRQGGRSNRLRGSQRCDAGSQKGIAQDESDDY